MLDQTTLHRYLEDVASYLHLDGERRERVLAEIEGHLHDAVDSHISDGLEPIEAVQRAIAEMGPPSDVATQFAPVAVPVRSVRGLRRWIPIVVPATVLAVALAVSLWNLALILDGATVGERVLLKQNARHAVINAALVAMTYVAIRNGDRDPAWRRAAWALAAVTACIAGAATAL